MGYVPLPPPNPSLMGDGRGRVGFRPNLDRFGLPRDFETYLWATYGPGSRIPPERRAFLYGSRDGCPDLGLQVMLR